MTTLALHTMSLRRKTVWGGWKAVTLLLEHITNWFELMKQYRSIGQCRVQEFVRGGGVGENLSFFCFSIFQGGPAQKIAEKMILAAKYR